ncbi:MAG: class I SAM-dependent rRNA methyltransferase [Bacteroidales bacterium]|nr:class I SAM-dependent rRNA methyltransferase [Bacteroidales bacterium]
MKRVYLKPRKEESLQRFHPWVFSGAIQSMTGKPEEGETVEVYSSGKEFLALGHYQIGSIAVRIVSFQPDPVDANFWRSRIREAYSLRKAIGLVRNDNTTYRLVHGEGDHLPGLIVDVYDQTAVMQAHSAGMHLVRQELAQAIVDEVEGVSQVYYKSETTLPYKAGLEPEDGYLIGGAVRSHVATENGLHFNVDWLRGQKTGFFVDQRDNRQLLEQYSYGKQVLNMFCYTGGFSVYAMRGGARLVHSVDSSAKAVELTDKNIELNFAGDRRHASFAEDAFKFLVANEHTYDLVVLDPPAFAKHRDALRNALRGYQRLNARGIAQIKSGGILFTFSCSQVVTKDQFRPAVFSAAAETGRKVRILHQLSQPADHPVNIYHPEGEYLKGLVLYVE